MFYPQQTVILGNAFAATAGSRFNMPYTGGNGQINNSGVFGFSGTV